MKLKQRRKHSLCYSKSIDVHTFLAKQTYITGIVNLLCMHNDTKECWNICHNYIDLKNHVVGVSHLQFHY